MFKKALLSVALLFLLFSAVSATPTAQGLATAPVAQGNALSDSGYIASYWGQNGKTTSSLLLAAATKSSILDYWKNDGQLLVYNNIGHGDTPNYDGAPCYGLEVYGGEITASDISNLNPSTGISGTQIFINSCNSFENPLHDALLSKNVFKYIGGVVILPQGSSEDTAKDYWYNNQILGQTSSSALLNAENSHGTTGMYGTY